jgi:DNA-directed RNA polymerase subunit beta
MATWNVKYGCRERLLFIKNPETMDPPHFIEIQKKSYEDFLQKDISSEQREDKGLQAVFNEVLPVPLSETSYIEFVSYTLGEPKYNAAGCQERGLTYAVPLKIRVRLIVREKNKDTGEKETIDVRESDVYMGELPLMTERGTFIINGIERVIVSQLHRSPGVTFFKKKKTFLARIIPVQGAWLELEIEHKTQGVIYAKLAKQKTLATVILRALGWETDEEILSLFAEKERLELRPWRDEVVEVSRGDFDSLLDMVPPEDIYDPDTGEPILNGGKRIGSMEIQMLKNSSIQNVKVLDKSFPSHLIGRVVAEPVIDEERGETIAEVNDEITYETLKECYERGVKRVTVLKEKDAERIESLRATLKRDDASSQKEALKKIPLDLRMLYFNPVTYDLSSAGRYKINKKLGLSTTHLDVFETLVFLDNSLFQEVAKKLGLDKADRKVEELHRLPEEERDGLLKKLGFNHDSEVRVLTRKDILETLKHLIKIKVGEEEVDDIYHLSNRRVRTVGELLQGVFREALTKMVRKIKRIDDLRNPKPLSNAIRKFFTDNPLSQFVKATNPLDELALKRRLSALGPGGLRRDQCPPEARDVHYTHYGRICPVETPERQDTGLILSLGTYARVNEYGFLETPYRKVVDGRVTDEIVYLSADEEDQYLIAHANTPIDENRYLRGDKVIVENGKEKRLVIVRHKGDFPEVPIGQVDFIDVSPKQIVGVSASLIPFLEHDDANRALMGSNMQRQAVPLLIPQAPIVGTGMEHKVAVESGAVITARRSGVDLSPLLSMW